MLFPNNYDGVEMKKLISAISLSLLFASAPAFAADFTWYKNGDCLSCPQLGGAGINSPHLGRNIIYVI
jgi:hypothetical protein